jgi:hypothetical protein
MAKNRSLDHGKHLPNVVVASTFVSGDPIVLGEGTADLPGVVVVDRNTEGVATVERDGSFWLNVNAVNAGGNSAVALWDIIYWTAADPTKLSKKATGKVFGYALTTLAAGATGQVEVLIHTK